LEGREPVRSANPVRGVTAEDVRARSDAPTRSMRFDTCSFTLDVTRTSWHLWAVIVSYRDKRTREFAAGKRVKAFSGFARSARLKLDRMEAATLLRDLSALPGNRFEALVGDRKGQYSIRINDQWRICIEGADRLPGPSNVEIVDYH
jgi:toxin HigB-1